jgi:hypothetical protein
VLPTAQEAILASAYASALPVTLTSEEVRALEEPYQPHPVLGIE